MDTNDTRECMKLPDQLEKYYLTSMYTFEFIFGFIGNVVVGLGSLFFWKTWKSSNIYLINLILSDLSFLCTLPWLVSSYSKRTDEHMWCQFNRIFLFLNLYTSILFLTFISIDRYLLIKYPFRNHFLQKRATAIVFSVAIWIWVMLELSPVYYFITSQNNSNNSSQCLDYASSGVAVHSLIYSLMLTVAGFIIPLCIMWFFYIKTRALLISHSLQFTAALPIEKPLVLIIMAVSIFSILFAPYHIMRNVRIASRASFWKPSACTQNLIKAVYTLTRPIAFLNSVINPIFYFLMGDHFRETLMINIRYFLKRVLPCYK